MPAGLRHADLADGGATLVGIRGRVGEQVRFKYRNELNICDLIYKNEDSSLGK